MQKERTDEFPKKLEQDKEKSPRRGNRNDKRGQNGKERRKNLKTKNTHGI